MHIFVWLIRPSRAIYYKGFVINNLHIYISNKLFLSEYRVSSCWRKTWLSENIDSQIVCIVGNYLKIFLTLKLVTSTQPNNSTVLEPSNMWNYNFGLHKVRQSPDFKASKLWNALSGTTQLYIYIGTPGYIYIYIYIYIKFLLANFVFNPPLHLLLTLSCWVMRGGDKKQYLSTRTSMHACHMYSSK